VAQPGSVPEWGSGGRGFKSRRPDLEKQGSATVFVVGPCFVCAGWDNSRIGLTSLSFIPLRHLPEVRPHALPGHCGPRPQLIAEALLIAFVGAQRGAERLRVGTPLYNVLNLVGALILLYVAVIDRRAGFIILEAVWAAVTIPPLYRSFRSASSR
jgi:hypothetical protein